MPSIFSNSASGGQTQAQPPKDDLKSQIDFLNQLAQANTGNDAVQKALLEQYMGLINPPKQNDNDTFSKGADLLKLGAQLQNPELISAGQSLIKGIPSMGGHFGATTPTKDPAQPSISDMYMSKFNTDHAVADESGKPIGEIGSDSFLNNTKMLDAVKSNPSLAEQYYKYQPSWGDRLGYAGKEMNPFSALGTAFGLRDNQIRQNQIFGRK